MIMALSTSLSLVTSWLVILAIQTCVNAQATLHALEDPSLLGIPTSLSSPSSTGAVESTFIKAVGIGSDGFTTYEEIHIPLTTSPASTATSTSGGFNFGGLNVTEVDTFAEAASAYKTQASWSSAGVKVSESLSCNFLSQESASCVDIYEFRSVSKTVTSTTTLPALFKPIFTVATGAPASTSTASVAPETTTSTATTAKANAGSIVEASSLLFQLSVIGCILITIDTLM